MLRFLFQLHVYHFDQFLNLLSKFPILLCSPFSNDVGCSSSSTCIGIISSVTTPFLCSSSWFLFSYHSLLLNSCSSFSLFSVSCSFTSTSYKLSFSLLIHSPLFICCSLFSFVAKASFMIIIFSFMLHIFSPSWLLAIFLFPLSCTGLLPSIVVVVSFGVTPVCGSSFKFLAILTDSLSLEAFYQYL